MDEGEFGLHNEQFHRSMYKNQKQRVEPDLKIGSGQIWHKKIAQSDSNESKPTDGESGYERNPEQRRTLNEVQLLMRRNQTHKSCHSNISANHQNSSTRKETDKETTEE